MIAATSALPASGQLSGDRPVCLIVPVTAGSTVDAVARTMRNEISKALDPMFKKGKPIFRRKNFASGQPGISGNASRADSGRFDQTSVDPVSCNVVQWHDWFLSREVNFTPTRFSYRFDRTAMALEAAVQGLGIACDSASIGRPHMETGKLKAVLDEEWYLKVHSHFMVLPIETCNARK